MKLSETHSRPTSCSTSNPMRGQHLLASLLWAQVADLLPNVAKKTRLLGFCATASNNSPNAPKFGFSGKKRVDAPEPDTHNSGRTVTRQRLTGSTVGYVAQLVRASHS